MGTSMALNFGTLGLVIIAEILIIISIFNFVHTNVESTTRNKVIINISEILTLVILVGVVIYTSLIKMVEQPILGFIIIFSLVIMSIIWSITRIDIIRTFFNIDTGLVQTDNNEDIINLSANLYSEVANSEEVISEEDNNVIITKSSQDTDVIKQKNRSDKDFVVFSKYINRSKENNFSFGDMYPDYNDLEKAHNIGTQSKDYSAYNGYPDDHICSGCGCMRREDGYKFCGKFIPGMGTIGCSDRWGCLNCKRCPQGTNTVPGATNQANEDDYSCLNCKCHETDAGYICGKIDRTSGYVHKCDSTCSKCDKCYGADGSTGYGAKGMITADPISNLASVKVENENRILELLN